MNSTEIGWESLLDTDSPSGCSLRAALFTTYDRADERLLVEHLLPLLLKLGREPDGEGTERQYFLLELDQRLKHLHDRIVVISSTAHDEPTDTGEGESSAYGWIWRSIRHLTVGSKGKAVQHAKLWLLHWNSGGDEGGEYLEIVVSSANLTRAAFRGQLQAAWRCCLNLRPQRSESRLRGWGILPAFLRELASSVGSEGRLEPFVELLARAECPEEVTFVASVPGMHTARTLQSTPWGAAGLRNIIPSGRGMVRVSILSPYIGSWSSNTLGNWCERSEGDATHLELVWIARNHPWTDHWLLPIATLEAITGAGANLLRLRHEPGNDDESDHFHDDHRVADERWSHAKVYSLKRGNSRRLLVTSANFSPAAWGRAGDDGSLTIENFELGVSVDQAVWPFECLKPFEDIGEAATVSELPERGTARITWAQAEWDGRTAAVRCRCEAGHELKGEITGIDVCRTLDQWTIESDGRLHSAEVPWEDAVHPPAFVRLVCEDETVTVPVFDEREAREREDSVPPEVDEHAVQQMRDELLFEQYGGRVAADVESPVAENQELTLTPGEPDEESDGELSEDESGQADCYAVPTFVLARRYLAVVDNWVERMAHAMSDGTNKFERQVLRRDGEFLVSAFNRQTERDMQKGPTQAIAARLAAEELSLRLKHISED